MNTTPGNASLLFLPAWSLCWREVKRFARQRSRVAGVLISPLVFWVFLGLGFGSSFRPPGATEMDYLEFFYPGTVLLVILFTAIFSTISVIEDRREGFLQSVVVSPASPAAVALGKITGGTLVALVQGLILLLLARPAGIPLGPAQVLPALGVLFAAGFGLTGLGFALAWRMDSTQGFHSVMNLVLVPMWMLSGAVFPVDSAPAWLRLLVQLNPVAYSVAALRRTLYPHALPESAGPSLGLALGVTLVFAAITWFAAARVAGTTSTSGRG